MIIVINCVICVIIHQYKKLFYEYQDPLKNIFNLYEIIKIFMTLYYYKKIYKLPASANSWIRIANIKTIAKLHLKANIFIYFKYIVN